VATATINYASAASITCTLTSLASAGWRQSAEVSNTTNKYIDALVAGSIQAGSVTADGTIEVYAYGSIDGTVYSGGLGTTDQGITWGTTGSTSVHGYNQLKLLQVLDVDDTDDNEDIEFGPVSVASVFGGVLPEKWGVIVKNNTGASLHATGTNNAIKYQGIKFDSA
jgi:hypothetical protein